MTGLPEQERLAVLRALEVLDTPPDPALDALVELAAQVFGTSTASISLVDENRQWLKARTGNLGQEAPRETAFCDHTIRGSEVMVVNDAARETIFQDNPLVVGDPFIRFYAGAPLTVDGARVGALCVIDQQPRADFDAAARDKLAALATAVASILKLQREVKLREATARTLAEQARKLAMAETMARVGHWAINLKTGAIFWSAEVYRIHGVDPSRTDLTFADLLDFYVPQDRAVVQNAADRARSHGEGFNFKLRVRRVSDGAERVVTAIADVTFDAGGLPETITGMLQDVTEQERMAQRTARDLERYRLLTQNATDVIAAYGQDGTFTYASPSVVNLLGIDAEAVIGRKAWEFIAEADHARVLQQFGALLREGAVSARVEYRALHSDGRQIWVEARPSPQYDAAGRFLGFHDVVRDISARRAAEAAAIEAAARAEAALAASSESEARYRLLAENANDMIATMAPDSTVLFVTPAVERVLGYTPEEIIGRKTLDVTHPEDIPRVVKLFTDLIKAGENQLPKAYPFRGLHKNGNWVWLEGQPRIEFDAAGRPVSYQDVVRDISARKLLEQELKAAKNAAEAAGRAKADFLANMSHELRTPLSSVIGFADVLVASPGLGADEQRYAGLVRNAGRRLLSIVNDVLDLAKIESGIVPLDAAPVDLRPLAADTLEMVRLQAAEKGLTLHIDLPRGPVLVQTDADRIRQILLNLLGNAVKFTESGAVTLALRAAPGAAGVAVEMSVTDTGIGIPRHRINRLFQRFEQGDNSITRQYGGTGLGLAICHELVVQMGGTITAASEPGLGTCFTVKLELPAASAPPAAEARYDPTGALAGLRILVAEDVKLNQELIGLFLKPAGARIDFVGNGAEAVSAAEGAAYDAIMMDVQMPVMDGLEASRRIRAGSGASRGAPIIALTASVLPEEVDRVRQAGMSDHLGKPFSANDLIATIARWARAGPIAPARAGCLEVAGAAPQMPK